MQCAQRKQVFCRSNRESQPAKGYPGEQEHDVLEMDLHDRYRGL